MGLSAGSLLQPAGAPWLANFRAELLSFPAGYDDDQVDALSLVAQLLDTTVKPGDEGAGRLRELRWQAELVRSRSPSITDLARKRIQVWK